MSLAEALHDLVDATGENQQHLAMTWLEKYGQRLCGGPGHDGLLRHSARAVDVWVMVKDQAA